MKERFKEPLLHFLVIGGLLFVLFSVVDKEERGDVIDGRIVITTTDIERLRDGWARKWNRPPTGQELYGLIESQIREEVYYREALALGLDRDDTVIRRRLMQKMEFLSNDLADLSAPDERALEEFFLENPDKYRLPPRVAFTHIYFNTDKRGGKAPEDARRVLSELNSTTGPLLRVPERGDTFMMPYDYNQKTPSEVARLFGSGFADRLFKSDIDINVWQGPIESGYGLHLVRIDEKIDPGMPELASVIGKVRTDLIFEQREKTNKDIYRRLKEGYEIVVQEIPVQPGLAKLEGDTYYDGPSS